MKKIFKSIAIYSSIRSKEVSEISLHVEEILDGLDIRKVIPASSMIRALSDKKLRTDEYVYKNADFFFLGAWNFKKEIFKKEKKFIKNGGKFIVHVPSPQIINK